MDIRSKDDDLKNFHLWWLGQSGYLIKWKGNHLMIDPYLSDSLTLKYSNTDKPHIRLSELIIAPERFNFIDLVTSSHNHTDHLDGETLKPLFKVNPNLRMIIPEANRHFVADRIEKPANLLIGLNDGESAGVKGFRITGVPAAHNDLERDSHGNCLYMGYIIQMGKWTIYHSGDTLWHDDVVEALQPYSIDLALLPINGNKLERRVAGNLDYREAVLMAKAINARHVIPCHYDMFSFNTEDPENFRKMAVENNQRHTVLSIGSHFSSEII